MNPLHIQQACERTQNALILAQYKPSPKGQGGGSSNIEPPTPLPVTIISAKRELRDILLLWVDLVSDGMDVVAHCDPTEHSMLEWLTGHERAEYLANHDAATDFLDELTTITKQIESPYEAKPVRTWLGTHGGGEVHVRENQTAVTLEDGRVENIETLRAWNRDQMRLAQGTAKEVAEIIWEFFGHYIKPRKISITRDHDADPRYKVEDKLEPIRKDGRNHIYRVQDVLTRFGK